MASQPGPEEGLSLWVSFFSFLWKKRVTFWLGRDWRTHQLVMLDWKSICKFKFWCNLFLFFRRKGLHYVNNSVFSSVQPTTPSEWWPWTQRLAKMNSGFCCPSTSHERYVHLWEELPPSILHQCCHSWYGTACSLSFFSLSLSFSICISLFLSFFLPLFLSLFLSLSLSLSLSFSLSFCL